MSTHNIGFYEDLARFLRKFDKNYLLISSNTHLISSSVMKNVEIHKLIDNCF